MKLLVFLAIASVVRSQSLPEVLTREGATTLVDFVVKAGLAETLSGDGPFTVFAPTNEAFERLPQSTVDALTADPELLKKVLLYHVVPAEVKSSDVTSDDVLVDTAEGSKLRVNVYMKKFYYDVSYLKLSSFSVKLQCFNFLCQFRVLSPSTAKESAALMSQLPMEWSTSSLMSLTFLPMKTALRFLPKMADLALYSPLSPKPT